jgi:hypothetical protein
MLAYAVLCWHMPGIFRDDFARIAVAACVKTGARELFSPGAHVFSAVKIAAIRPMLVTP